MKRVTKQEIFEAVFFTPSLYHRYEFEDGSFYWTNSMGNNSESIQEPLEDMYKNLPDKKLKQMKS